MHYTAAELDHNVLFLAHLDHNVLLTQELNWTLFYSYNSRLGPPSSIPTTADLDYHVMHCTAAELDHNVLFVQQLIWTTMSYSYRS